MFAEADFSELKSREEELDFRRDLIEYSPESFSGEDIINLLMEQRRLYNSMTACMQRDFASQPPYMREALLASLDGELGHDREWWESTLTDTAIE